MHILPLDLEHEAALRDFVEDFRQAGESGIPAYFADPAWPHAEIVRRFAAWSRGEVDEDKVPTTTSFLMHAERILGVSNFRHRLTPRLERHGGHVGFSVRPSDRGQGHATRLLAAAKVFGQGLGIPRLLVTCQPENLASARVIEKNGGIFEDEFFDEVESCDIRRYWIPL